MKRHEDEFLIAARAAARAPQRVAPGRHQPAAQLLARAFADDPVMRWVFRNDARTPEAFDTYFDMALGQQCARHGRIYAAADGNAAAVWLPPEGLKELNLPLWRMLLMLPRWVRITGLDRMQRGTAMGDAMARHHPKTPPHWYLFFVGVHPDLRGRGLGASILEATLEPVDAAGLPAYLDNSNPRNTRLYERFGFKTICSYRPQPDAPEILGMWREPRPRQV